MGRPSFPQSLGGPTEISGPHCGDNEVQRLPASSGSSGNLCHGGCRGGHCPGTWEPVPHCRRSSLKASTGAQTRSIHTDLKRQSGWRYWLTAPFPSGTHRKGHVGSSHCIKCLPLPNDLGPRVGSGSPVYAATSSNEAPPHVPMPDPEASTWTM